MTPGGHSRTGAGGGGDGVLVGRPYEPVLAGDAVWAVAFALIYPVVAVVGIDLPAGRPRLKGAVDSTRAFLAAAWGQRPDPEVRFGRRKLAGACGVVEGAVVGMAVVMLVGVAHATGLQWVRWIAAVLGLLAGFATAAGVVFGTRGSMTVMDATEWENAGRPRDWKYRRSTQPRTIDLVAIGFVGSVFSVLLVGSVVAP